MTHRATQKVDTAPRWHLSSKWQGILSRISSSYTELYHVLFMSTCQPEGRFLLAHPLTPLLFVSLSQQNKNSSDWSGNRAAQRGWAVQMFTDHPSMCLFSSALGTEIESEPARRTCCGSLMADTHGLSVDWVLFVMECAVWSLDLQLFSLACRAVSP